MVARRQAHGAKEHADRDLTGEIVDELELLSLAYAFERAVGNIESGCNELLDVLARERGLAQRAQPIVAGGGGGCPRGAPRRGGGGGLGFFRSGGRFCLTARVP